MAGKKKKITKNQIRRKLPENWSEGKWSKQSLKVLKERYLAKDKRGRVIESPAQMVYRVAWEAVRAEELYGTSLKEKKSWLKKYYQIMISQDFLPNSPTLMNAGKGNNLQYSACFVVPVEDSMDGIFDAIKRAAIIHKSGGGTGFSFSRLRPGGSAVESSGGVASGPVSFMRVFDSATNEIKQGGTRRGANMAVLRVDHPDILHFIESKITGGITNFNISVGITDAFVKALKKKKNYDLIAQAGWPKKGGRKYQGGEKIGQLSAVDIFEKIVDCAWKTGDPGIVWLDKINKSRANPVLSMGPIEATNPCLVGSSLVSTNQGLVFIKDLVEGRLKTKVLTDNQVLGEKGYQFSEIEDFYNNGKKEVWKLVTKGGFELKGTADHKIFTQRGWVELAQLKTNQDKVILQAQEGQFSQKTRLPFKVENQFSGKNGQSYQLNLPEKWSGKLGQVLGYLVGDGWLRVDVKDCRVGFVFGKDSQLALKEIKAIVNNWYGKEIKPVKRENGVYQLSYHSKYLIDFFQKLGVKPVKAASKQVPESIFGAPRQAVIGFLQGLFSADGTVGFQKEKRSKYIRLTSKSPVLLKGVQMLLLNLGILSRIYDRSRSAREVFPYTTKEGEQKKYLSDGVLFELNISREGMDNFIEEVGFMENKHQEILAKASKIKSYSSNFSDLVVEVKNTNKKETVYDLSVPQISSFIAQGILVHNCGEQPLYPNEACNLGSINLAKMLRGGKFDWEKLKKVTCVATRFLDNIIDVSPFPYPEITDSVLKNRRIGLGVMGWADLLFKLNIPYDSSRAFKLGEKIMKYIQHWGWKTSEELAVEKGAFPNFKKSIYKKEKPKRNATVTTIAPTGSISIIGDCSSGIEPAFALAYLHKTEDRTLEFINPIFNSQVKKYKSGKDILRQVVEIGSLGGMKNAPKRLKEVFKTAHEITYQDHIKTQAAFQKYTDNAVSKTINLINTVTKEDIEKAYLLSYEAGCRGITVFRDGCKGEQVLNAGKEKEKEEEKKEKGGGVKNRPHVVRGYTYRIETPLGTAFTTVNHNGHEDQPLEVFVNVGKVGSDIAADAEAIGRLISLCLRISSPGMEPKQVAELIVDQLSGIGGGSSVGFGKDRVRSLPDAVAKVIKRHLMNGNGKKTKEIALVGEQPTLSSADKSKKGTRDICPSCGLANLIYEEGCSKCLSCNYSKC